MTPITTDLTVVGLHTPQPQVFWKGAPVPGVVAFESRFNATTNRVVLTVAEDPQLAEMAAAGVIIKREAV
jgi:hypothetical protein